MSDLNFRAAEIEAMWVRVAHRLNEVTRIGYSEENGVYTFVFLAKDDNGDFVLFSSNFQGSFSGGTSVTIPAALLPALASTFAGLAGNTEAAPAPTQPPPIALTVRQAEAKGIMSNLHKRNSAICAMITCLDLDNMTGEEALAELYSLSKLAGHDMGTYTPDELPPMHAKVRVVRSTTLFDGKVGTVISAGNVSSALVALDGESKPLPFSAAELVTLSTNDAAASPALPPPVELTVRQAEWMRGVARANENGAGDEYPPPPDDVLAKGIAKLNELRYASEQENECELQMRIGNAVMMHAHMHKDFFDWKLRAMREVIDLAPAFTAAIEDANARIVALEAQNAALRAAGREMFADLKSEGYRVDKWRAKFGDEGGEA